MFLPFSFFYYTIISFVMTLFNQKLLKLYQEENIFENSICLSCRKTRDFQNDDYYPLGFWHIGKFYSHERIKILFAGKPHRGTPYDKIIRGKNFTVAKAENVAKNLFFNVSWPYWSYTKEILKKIFHTDEKGAWERLAFMNVIKCTVPQNSSKDNTPGFLKNFCLREFGIFWKELKLLKPTHTILYLGKLYDAYITNETIETFLKSNKIEEITSENYYIHIGKKKCWWWYRIIYLSTREKIHFLRICHP
ncbi:MAG: hypothetical protein DSZ31_05230, partial [Gammaproteobacteria bacterium]